jgi:hypothetical protein
MKGIGKMYKKFVEWRDKLANRLHNPLHSSFKLMYAGHFGAYAIYEHEFLLSIFGAVLFSYCVADLFFHFLGD